jgi:hypothetical protein
VKKNLHQHIGSLLETLQGLLWNEREVKTFRALVALFLSTELRTTLQNVIGISASKASRFLSCEQVPDEVYWQTLNKWQFEQFRHLQELPRRGRRGDVLLKVDLTCIEKTGKKIPFARIFNRVFGIQLVVLHACVNGLSFPLAYRIYEGKGQATTVELALDLLAAFPPALWSSRVVVLADAGFGSSEFITGAQDLGFRRLLVGVRCDRKLSDKRRLEQLKRRGQALSLHDLPEIPVWISWCDVKRDNGKKRFFLLSTFAAGGAYLARRYRRRWIIESFFKSVKHDFGLKEARLSTNTGIRLWIFLACLSFCLASFERHLSRQSLNLLQAAECILESLTDILLIELMSDCERLSRACKRPLKVVCV